MHIFQHVGKPAIIAAYCMQKLHAIIAHETTALSVKIQNEKEVDITLQHIVIMSM